jgi:hypothetical protein
MIIIIVRQRQLWADCPKNYESLGVSQQGGADIVTDTGFHVCGLLQPAGLRWRYLYSPHVGEVEVEVEVDVRPTVSWPAYLGVRHLSGTRDQFFFLLEISFRQLRVCYFVAPSLTRRWVSALPEQSLLGRSPAELTALFYCLIWDSLNLEGRVPVFISPRNRVAQLYTRALGSLFVACYDLQGYGGGILTRHC